MEGKQRGFNKTGWIVMMRKCLQAVMIVSCGAMTSTFDLLLQGLQQNKPLGLALILRLICITIKSVFGSSKEIKTPNPVSTVVFITKLRVAGSFSAKNGSKYY